MVGSLESLETWMAHYASAAIHFTVICWLQSRQG